MINSSPTFIALILLTNAHLSVTRENTASGDQESVNNNKVEKINWDDHRLPKPEYHPLSLTCLLFKDLGCDVECAIVTHAFKLLGGGACDTNNVCSCSFAQDPTFVGAWKEKFASTDELRDEIEDNKERFPNAKQILYTPLNTGMEIKEKLKEGLSPDQYEELEVIDFASKMNTAPNEVATTAVENYVAAVLYCKAMQSSRKELSSNIDVKENLIKALKHLRSENDKFTAFVSEIRKIENTFLNQILDDFIKNNHISLNEEGASNQISNVADAISKSIINNLVKMTKKPEKSRWQSCINWVGENVSYVFTLGFLPSSPADTDTILKNENFFKQPGLKKIVEGSAPKDSTYRNNKCTLRYQRSENSNYINLTWIKKPIVVSMLKTTESNFSQNWFFGTVRIYLTRMNNGDKSENWDFGEVTYEYRKIIDSNGKTYSNEEWSGTRNKAILEKHQSYIRTWCKYNDFLIGEGNCVIFEEIKGSI